MTSGAVDFGAAAQDRARPRATLRSRWMLALLAAVVVALMLLTLSCGNGCLAPAEVITALLGQDGASASFVVGGVAFQLMLRNPLASPDIIGISASAGAAAVFAIVILSHDGWIVSAVAVLSGLLVATLIWALSSHRGAAGARLILIGIGISAMLDSVTAYVLLEAPAWDRAEALRWLTGSVNGR